VPKNALISIKNMYLMSKEFALAIVFGKWGKLFLMNIDFIIFINFMVDILHGVAGGIAGITVDIAFYPL